MEALLGTLKSEAAESGTQTISVYLNGKLAKQMRVDRKSLVGPDLQLELPTSALKRGENKLHIESSAGQSGTYALEFRQTVKAESMGIVLQAGGLTIDRVYRKMEAQPLEDGTIRLLPSKNPVTQASPGDILQCELTVRTDRPREFMLVEDPLLSNAEAADSDGLSREYWWCGSSVRDDRMAFFIRAMTKGTQKITYKVRVQSPGLTRAMPTRIENMYDEKQQAEGGETEMAVVR